MGTGGQVEGLYYLINMYSLSRVPSPQCESKETHYMPSLVHGWYYRSSRTLHCTTKPRFTNTTYDKNQVDLRLCTWINQYKWKMWN